MSLILGCGARGKRGTMIEEGRKNRVADPWESVFAGTAITLTLLGCILAGDALRDEFDPRLRGR